MIPLTAGQILLLFQPKLSLHFLLLPVLKVTYALNVIFKIIIKRRTYIKQRINNYMFTCFLTRLTQCCAHSNATKTTKKRSKQLRRTTQKAMESEFHTILRPSHKVLYTAI